MTVNFIYTCLSLCGACAGTVIAGHEYAGYGFIGGFIITFIALIIAESIFLEITKERKV